MLGMPLISEPDRQRLRQKFERELGGDVHFELTRHERAQPCRTCTLTDELLSELVALSERFSMQQGVGEEDEHLPGITLRGRARGHVGFRGLPSGFELPAFIDSILDVSRGTTELSGDIAPRLSRLERDVRIQVFTTPT